MKILKAKFQDKGSHNLIPLEEIKHYLRVTHNHDNASLDNMALSAIENAENFLRFYLIERRFALKIEGGLRGNIVIQHFPLKEITSFKYTDNDGEHDYSKDHYEMDIDDGVIILNEKVKSINAEIKYVAGYGVDMPANIKQGLLKHISYIYDGKAFGANLPDEVISFYMMNRRYLI